MAATHYRTLVIETGVLCNNRCTFCYQQGYRSMPGYPRLVPGEDVRARMLWGLQNGYDEVSLTGGEPTIRPDFLELVRYAREIGYRRVAITTNGWRLAHPDFFLEARDAGLTSLGVSIHGPTPEIHDEATGHKGSFHRASQAIRNAVATHGSSRPVRLNTFTVIHRGNADRLAEIGRLLSSLGVRLMVFQPGILSKSNFVEASHTQVNLAEVIDGLRRVILEGVEHGFRVKLFNLPPCLFRDVLNGLDLDAYERATFRENDDSRPGSRSRGDDTGYMRLPACEACALLNSCPGLHVTLAPQEDLASHFEVEIDAISAWQHPQLWLAGTDLLKASSLFRVVRKARLAGFPDVRVTTGGSSISGRAGIVAARQAGASEIVLVHHAVDPHSGDRILCHAGNDAYLAKTLDDIASVPRDGMGLSVLVSASQAAIDLLESPGMRLLSTIPFNLYLRAPWRVQDSLLYNPGMLSRFLLALVDGTVRPQQTVLQVPWPRPLEAAIALPLAAAVTAGWLRFDMTGTVMPTAFADRHYSVLNWSLPHLGGLVCAEKGELLQVRELQARSVRAQPITREALILARSQGAGAGNQGFGPPPPRHDPGTSQAPRP
jgi:pyruvate-formate lyase-activating enzyme